MSTAVIGSPVTVRVSAPRLRLTRRGRFALAILFVVPLVLGAFFFVVNGGGATASIEGGSSFEYVTVQGGQTLWQLATDLAPTADPRDVVSDIVHLNRLSSSDVQAGQRLAIPQQYEK